MAFGKSKKSKSKRAPFNKMVVPPENKGEIKPADPEPEKPVKVYCSACDHIRRISAGECGHPKNVTEEYWVPGRRVYKSTKELNLNGDCNKFEK